MDSSGPISVNYEEEWDGPAGFAIQRSAWRRGGIKHQEAGMSTFISRRAGYILEVIGILQDLIRDISCKISPDQTYLSAVQ